MSSLPSDVCAHLLRIAREALAAALAGRDDAPATAPDPRIESHGVFVTLRKGAALRGCIGTFSASDDLCEAVRTMAVAALGDPRFESRRVSSSELADLRIEISVLSPLEKIADPLSLRLGAHGIYIRKGAFGGCFLPDVAAEYGWDAETFLTQCCSQKAGLSPTAWKQPDTEVFVFTVQKISDPA